MRQQKQSQAIETNSGTSTFTYNGFGELKTQTNNANQTVSLSYDKLGRVLTRTEPEGVTTFEYDSATQCTGQLARESSGVSMLKSHGFHSFAVSRTHVLERVKASQAVR